MFMLWIGGAGHHDSFRDRALRLTHRPTGMAGLIAGRISDDGGMEWTFTGEVIEWRGPAPYLFVAMTPEESLRTSRGTMQSR